MTSDATQKPDEARSGVSDAATDDEVARFSPEEEAALVTESNTQKAEANALFGSGNVAAALAAYDRAVTILPPYRHYERAVLHSNRAACCLKQEAWKEAVDSATAAMDALERDEGGLPWEGKKKEAGVAAATTGDRPVASETPATAKLLASEHPAEEADEEITSAGARSAAQPPATTAPVPMPTTPTTPTPQDRLRIRAKALLRRARARVALGGWANLAGAEEDYRALAALPDGTLGAADRRLAAQQLRALPARTAAAKEAEMGEMMGKLKELGNGLLRPFGLSTENFQMTKDEATGGYSMNFRPGGE